MAKKILFITSSYPFGSGENFLNPEIKSFSTFFDDIYIMPTYPRGSLKDLTLTDKNISYLKLPLFRFYYIYALFLLIINNFSLFCQLITHCRGGSFIQFFRNIVLIPKSVYVAEIVRKLGVDFIYTHWLSAPMQLSMLLHILTKIPYGGTGHRWDIIDNNNFLLKFKYAKFIRFISYKSLNLLPLSVKNYHEKMYVIYMGVEIDNKFLTRFESQKRNILLSNDTNPTQSIFRIVCIANFLPVKGHKYLIDAVKELHNKGYIVYLDLIGGGELESEIRKQIHSMDMNKYIKLLGVLGHLEILRRLESCQYDIYCQPSIDLGEGLHEGIPVALMEAISFGLPCISTQTGSIFELIENNYCGILVKDKDSKALALALEKYMLDFDTKLIYAQNALDKLNLKFNKDLNNKKIVDLINS